MKVQDLVKKLLNQGVTPKAALYARFSSENQRDESIDAQIRAIHEYAAEAGIVVVKEYVDKARSATNDDRENFQRMIKDAGTGEFHFIIVHKLDRFARNRRDSVGYRVELAKKHVLLVSVLENYDSDTPEGSLMEGLSELLAEFYSKNLSRESNKGQKENALAGKHNGGTPPFGYDVDPVTKLLVINEVEAVGVRKMFDMVQANSPYNAILEMLHKDGYKTKRGSDFGRNSLHDILRNPKYYGLYFFGRIEVPLFGKTSVNSHRYNNMDDIITIEDGIPAIISKEQFDAVQAILDARKQTRAANKPEKYLLTGKIFCGSCGRAYAGNKSVHHKTGIVHITYRCSGRRKLKDSRCRNDSINRDLLEQKVLNTLSDMIFDPDNVTKIIDRYERALQKRNEEGALKLKQDKKLLKELERKIENVLRMIEDGLGSKSLMERLDKLESEKEDLAYKLAIEESRIASVKVDKNQLKLLFNRAKDMFKAGTLDATKQLIDLFVDRVTVFSDSIVVKYASAPFVLDDESTIIEHRFDINDVRHYKKKNTPK